VREKDESSLLLPFNHTVLKRKMDYPSCKGIYTEYTLCAVSLSLSSDLRVSTSIISKPYILLTSFMFPSLMDESPPLWPIR